MDRIDYSEWPGPDHVLSSYKSIKFECGDIQFPTGNVSYKCIAIFTYPSVEEASGVKTEKSEHTLIPIMGGTCHIQYIPWEDSFVLNYLPDGEAHDRCAITAVTPGDTIHFNLRIE